MRSVTVERARDGDADAFAVLVRESGGRLLAIAYRILRDLPAAEDAVQQTFVTAWRSLAGLRDPERFDAWLHRILVRACTAEMRRSGRRATEALPLATEVAEDAHALRRVAERDEMERVFRRLSPEQRAVVVLRYYLDLRQEEIAETLGIPVGTVKSRLHHATSALRAALEADARAATIEERLA